MLSHGLFSFFVFIRFQVIGRAIEFVCCCLFDVRNKIAVRTFAEHKKLQFIYLSEIVATKHV